MTIDFLGGNRVTLLETGSQYFPALLAAIDTATRFVHLETYIFADDPTGWSIAAALGRAARRGVAVRVLVDGFGARGFAAGLGKALAAEGVEVLIYRPEMGGLRFRRLRLRRLHRKLAVVDGRIAFVGGINIIDDMDTPGQVPPRYDYAVAVEGPLLRPIQDAVQHLWQLVRWASFRRRMAEPAGGPARIRRCGNTAASFLMRDNLRHRRDIENAYLDAIADARREIVIACAYFMPGRRFRRALVEAATRGVRVVLLLQGRVEYRLLHYATQALYGVLIKAGVEIFEYRKSFLHAKVAVIDGDWATVGSSNIDPFSFLLSREANVVVRDAAFAALLRESLGRAMSTGARAVRMEDVHRRPLLVRAINWLAYSVVRMLIGVAGYGGKGYAR